MSQKLDMPFNVGILNLTPGRLNGLRPVTALDIFDGPSRNLHEDGLFSVSIFGRPGDEARRKNFSYIDIKAPIFHPVIYRALLNLKRFYGGIMAGAEYAQWDPVIKDFVRSSPVEGRTGYAFFLEHWKEIEFDTTKSTTRDFSIKMLKKYASTALTSNIVVGPAALRDIEIEGGRIKEDEINTFYRKLLSISNTISVSSVKQNPEVINIARYNLQLTFNALYEHLEKMVDGKNKMILGRWASRRVANGTRNVITAIDVTSPVMGRGDAITINHTAIGIYQFIKAILPIAQYQLRNGFLSTVFKEVNAPVKLVNKKTLKAETITLKSYQYDRWMTLDGIESIFNSFSEESIRHRPVEVEGRYLGLIYKGPDKTYRMFNDIDELPAHFDRKYVTPITLAELIYLSVYKDAGKYPIIVTRYPVAGMGSTYPSLPYLRSTAKYEQRRELDLNWQEYPDDGEVHTAYHFPVTGSAFFNTEGPHSIRLAGLTAD